MRKLALLSVLALPLTLSGCGATFPQVVTVATLSVDALCGGAAKLCESQDPECGASACQIAHTICAALPMDAPVQLSCSAH